MSKSFFKYLPKVTGREEGITEEGKGEIRETLTLDLEDAELIKVIDSRLKEGVSVKEKIDKVNEQNERFYLGDQIDKSKLYEHQAKPVVNRIYLAVDTIVPMLANKKRDPIAIPAQRTDESRELAIMTQDYLSWKWNEQQMKMKLAQIVRFMQIHRMAILKYRYTMEDEYNDFVVEVKRPESIIVENIENPSYIAEYLEDTAGTLIEKFALNDKGEEIKAKKKAILKALGIKETQLGTKVKYIEFWTDEFVVWKLKDVILDKAKNPNWLWDTKGKQFNQFRKPEMPYILFTFHSLGTGVYADTTSLEQAIPVQRNINKRKRQISDNADQASGTWIFNSRYIDRKEAAKFSGAPNEHIMFRGGEGTSVNEAVGRIFPKDLGGQVFQDAMDDKQEIDNIFGTHSTTRGERGEAKTATESALLKESDYGRLDLMSQYIDLKLQELYDAFVQMSLVYYDDAKTLQILGPEGREKYIDFSRDNIEEGIEVIVSSEPLLAHAEETNKYMQLFQSGLIDPLTMYEKLNLPNPKELTRRKIMLDVDPKMYLAEFATDEETPGMEDDPVNVAKEDIKRLSEGETVPPAPEVTRPHIKEHQKFMKSYAFGKLKDEIKALHIEHVREELDILKQQMQQSMPTVEEEGAPPPGGVPQMLPQGGPQGMPPGANERLQPQNPIMPGKGTG